MLNLEQNFNKIFGTGALPALNALFFDEYETAEDPRSQLFNMETTDRELVQKLEISSLGVMGVTAEGEQAPKDAFNQSFSKNYSMTKYAKAIGISDEMMADDQWSMISDMVKAGARSAKETELLTAFNVFNNAFSTETSSDGVSIINTAHPSQVGSQSNTLAAPSDLAYSSLAEAEQVFRQFRDDRGKRLLIQPKILLVSESDRQNALEIVKSPYKAGTANNNINALGADGGLTVISSPYLTDSDAWFLLASPSEHGLRIIDRSKLTTKTHEDVLAGVLYYKFEYRQALGCDKWRGIVGTAGA